ncbi:DUF3616 domain-containing protein [Botryobacter ruber]|uniref:DUF3616 domain-containing protein n=1 Tax=Botryobacter ruber TaxID=2171629 RepID=UPI000E0A36AC|nr:DUF3616 domain-containing protein [Botryobacter ruber]
MEQQVLLQFDAAQSYSPDGEHVRNDLSTVLNTGKNLWLACDERATVERLTQLEDGTYGKHKSFKLSDYLDLPGKAGEEVDIEGMGVAGNYLWIIGSHSLRRKKPRKHDSVEDQMKRLAKVKAQENRYMLARIPIVYEEETGDYTLHKACPHPDHKDKILHAAQLKGSKKGNELTKVLQKDEHLADYFRIPSKDNGFDIEGLCISGKRIFIGLRGPVLMGWALVLEIEVEEDEDKHGYLHLKKITSERPYKKHFLHLKGKGIRELRISNDDIFVLAGPTMDLDGVIAIYKWRNALKQEGDSMVWAKDLERQFEVPHGSGKTSGQDKAEGLAFFDDTTLLVVFDSPKDERKVGEDGVLADLYKVQ